MRSEWDDPTLRRIIGEQRVSELGQEALVFLRDACAEKVVPVNDPLSPRQVAGLLLLGCKYVTHGKSTEGRDVFTITSEGVAAMRRIG